MCKSQQPVNKALTKDVGARRDLDKSEKYRPFDVMAAVAAVRKASPL